MASHILNKHIIWWHTCGMQKIERTLTSDIAWEHLALSRDCKGYTRGSVECVRVAHDWLFSSLLSSETAPTMWTEFSGAAMSWARSTLLSAHQDSILASVLEAQDDDSTAYWACRCWKSWIFDSASKEASSTVYDLVCVITSMRKSLILLVGTIKPLT